MSTPIAEAVLPPVVCAPVIFAAIGAIAIKLLELAELKNVRRANWPDFRSFPYWLGFLFSPVLGGFVAYVYVASEIRLAPIVAVNVGVSAPVILKAMANAAAPRVVNPGEGA